MAEGRWLPWKERKVDIRPTPDYKELAKPLKKPPHGLEWRRLEDGAWELRSITKALSLLEQQEKDRKRADEDKEEREEGLPQEKERVPEFLEHVVMPDDTLTGICLKYKVKDRELRRLNGFVGNHFRMCDVLVIPNRFAAGQQPVQGAVGKQPMNRDDLMQIFRKVTRLGPQEARFYLETSAWDLAKALAEWREENRWEAQQSADGDRRQEAVERQQQQQRQQQLRKIQRQGPGTSGSAGGAGRVSAISGTRPTPSATGDKSSVGNDGNIELSGIYGVDDDGEDDDALASARVPLLSNSYGSSLPGVTFF